MNYQEFCDKYDVHGLNPQQEQAVKRVDGATLLLAVPGSGKTTVIVARTGYMLHVAGIDPKHILTLTYTRAAAMEMRERFIKKFGDANGVTPHFATINSFCLSVLRICTKEKGERLPELVPGNERIVREIASSMMREYPSDIVVRTLAMQIGKAKNEMMDAEQLKAVENDVLDFYEFFIAYRNYLSEHGLMDFDDQLLMADAFLEKYPDILARAQRQYRYISLDEAQDTSLVQHRIVKKLVGRTGNIFMVGDEDQSIYGFRGAYPSALLNFTNDYANAQVLKMETNYRSDQAIVRPTNAFIKRNAQRNDKNMTPASRQEGYVILQPIADMKVQPRMVLDEIKSFLGTPDTLAVLFRNNDSAIPILNLLVKEGIAVRSRDATSLFMSNFVVHDILSFFRLALNPADIQAFKQIYYKLGLYIKAAQVRIIEEMMQTGRYKTVFDAIQDCWQFTKMRGPLFALRQALLTIAKQKPEKGIDLILYSTGYYENCLLRKMDEGASETTLMLKVNIMKLVAMEYDTPQEFLKAIDDIQHYQGDSGSNVTLSTIHSSKGLEFDTVLIIDVIEGILPTLSQQKSMEDEEEEARLFYVGATRARHRLHFLLPRAMFQSPLDTSEYFDDFLKNALPPST